MEIKFKKYGNFQDKEVLPASTYNSAVATSSLITHSLVETIKTWYNGNNYELSVSSFDDLGKVRDVLGNSLINYIYKNDTIFKTQSSDLTTIPYNPSFTFSTNGALKKSILNYYEGIFSNNDSIKSITLLEINDSNIKMSQSSENVNIEHLSYFDGNKTIGPSAGARATGYGDSIIYPAIKYDTNGHVSGYTEKTYKSPSWSDCYGTLYSGNASLNCTIELNDSIWNYTFLIFSFKIYGSDGNSVCSYPVFVRELTDNRNEGAFIETLIDYKKCYNFGKINIIWNYQRGNKSISINKYMPVGESGPSVEILSVTGLVVGTLY